MALIGHFENERAYISGDVSSIYRSVFTNLAFINHRYFSQRASLGAPNNALLSADIVEFAKYFHAKNKKIILYGMCGGAALMILAAKQLDELKIPYRIILDRFSQRATDSIHLKNLIRHFRFSHSTFIYEKLYQLIILCFIYILMRVALKSTHNAYELGHLLQNIPKNKTLVLQIRDRKMEKDFADLYFHPEHELRAAQKSARGREKMLLRQLQTQAESLAEHFLTHSELCGLFHELKCGFADMQILIRNEKMTGNPSLKIPNCNITNLHSNKLSELTTRDNFSLARLIQGFIKSTHPDTNELFAQFEKIDLAQIKIRITALPWLGLNVELAVALSSPEKYQLAELLCSFLRTLTQEKTYLSYMADRAEFTALKDIKPALQGLLKTPLMLSLQPIKLSTGAHYLTLFPNVQAIEIQDNHATPACTKSSNSFPTSLCNTK